MSKKTEKIKINKPKPRIGHIPHRNGGPMDNREKKMRTRSNINQKEINYSKGEDG